MISSFTSLFAAASCTPEKSSFFGFPHWYEYLGGITDDNGFCVPALNGLNDVWKIAAAVIEILLRIAVFAAVAMIIYGAIIYITSQGEPDKTGQAKNTIVNALIGLAVAIMASFIITFIAGSIS